MLQAFRKHSKAMNNLHPVNQAMAQCLGLGTTLYFEEVEEKGQGGLSPLIFTPILEHFNICLTRMVQLRRSNHRVVQNFHFKAIEGQLKSQNREGDS